MKHDNIIELKNVSKYYFMGEEVVKAVGAQNKDIFLIFLIESGLLGLVGGIIGVALGIGIGKGVEYIAFL